MKSRVEKRREEKRREEKRREEKRRDETQRGERREEKRRHKVEKGRDEERRGEERRHTVEQRGQDKGKTWKEPLHRLHHLRLPHTTGLSEEGQGIKCTLCMVMVVVMVTVGYDIEVHTGNIYIYKCVISKFTCIEFRVS